MNNHGVVSCCCPSMQVLCVNTSCIIWSSLSCINLIPCEQVIAPCAPCHNTLLACEFMIQRLQTKINENGNSYLRLLSVKCQNWETFCSQVLRLTPSPSLSKHSPLPLERREKERGGGGGKCYSLYHHAQMVRFLKLQYLGSRVNWGSLPS